LDLYYYKALQPHTNTSIVDSDFLLFNYGSTNMDGVIKDLGKIKSTGTLVFKKLVYYGYIPLILYLGGRTIDWSSFFEKV